MTLNWLLVVNIHALDKRVISRLQDVMWCHVSWRWYHVATLHFLEANFTFVTREFSISRSDFVSLDVSYSALILSTYFKDFDYRIIPTNILPSVMSDDILQGWVTNHVISFHPGEPGLQYLCVPSLKRLSSSRLPGCMLISIFPMIHLTLTTAVKMILNKVNKF